MITGIIKTVLITIVVVALVDATLAATAQDWANVALLVLIAALLWPRKAT
jgi:cell shape-determining protein MreD